MDRQPLGTYLYAGIAIAKPGRINEGWVKDHLQKYVDHYPAVSSFPEKNVDTYVHRGYQRKEIITRRMVHNWRKALSVINSVFTVL